MKLLLIILIACAVLNAETPAPSDYDATLTDCNQLALDLQDQAYKLTLEYKKAVKERDDAVSQLGRETPPLLPWYAYSAFGFVAGGLAAFAVTR